ncbi:MAG: M20 family metallopeptidase [Candidatus Promineifilaceae bacterium]|jgi:amidohydrolase
MNKENDTMLSRAQKIAPEMVRLRRDIHRNPELGFQEVRTAGLVADTLSEIGDIEIKTGVGITGVVGDIGGNDGPTIAIRADMDALPITESNDVPYRSQHDGIMHACGHDAHTAMLLGAAQLLRQDMMENEWRGNVRFLFQPSEEAFDENGISGATAMLEDGALEGVDAVIALHVWSTNPAGEVYLHDGMSMAAVDSFDAWVRGDGGHGAYPHAGSDPLAMLAPILSSLYAIPSRRINPLLPVVVSLGQIEGGKIHNVIPNQVQLKGTIRSFDPGVREQLWYEVERALKLSEDLGGSYELRITKGYPALYNDPQINKWLRAVVDDFGAECKVQELPFGMGAEDFAYMARQNRGAMFMLGAAIPDGIERSHHTAGFDIDESVLPLGAAILAETARRFVTGAIKNSEIGV